MKQKDLLLLVGSFFFLVLLYIGFSIYHNSVSSTIPEDLNIQIIPISPVFDEKTISDLKKRASVKPIYEINGISASPTPTPLPSQTPTASNAAFPTPVATNSGRPSL